MSNWLKNRELLFSFRTTILEWFDIHKRDLPWRTKKNPYLTWIAEIIFQQTRIEQGMQYYHRFIKDYPSLKDLSQASVDEVLKNWEGLGYYSRARNLHFAAQQMAESGMPKNYKDWLLMKGVGPYTAAAIASTVYDEHVAAVDGNVQRVMARIFHIKEAVNTTEGAKKVQRAMETVLSDTRPGDFNEAIMEMGALICLPKKPKCKICPVKDSCAAYKDNAQEQLPLKLKKLKVRSRELHLFIIESKGKYLVQKRSGNDIWKGLYQFPMRELEKGEDIQGLSKSLQIEWSQDLNEFNKIHEVRHVLTHQRLKLCFWINSTSPTGSALKNIKGEWHSLEMLKSLSFPRPLRQVISEYLLHSQP